jgi:hypothetical protein
VKLEKAIREIEDAGKNTRFDRLLHVCTAFFGEPRVHGSHHVFKMPWAGDPRINLQPRKGGLAKPTQVRDVLRALERLAAERHEEEDPPEGEEGARDD